ncbi:extracellular solute-binding protein [Lacrimispora amygdalina]|jgi:arabinogalactan oligomer/maltooligosaccharide transport system substrate-binding protein|uniref:extracellular solute-binding protein n=1 Tax=Lacrimispora amygdalina TaxID=253257 RepID=UPI000BE2CEF4|nr:extracellular solute-binding protein [Lacrimispora amygdalina]
MKRKFLALLMAAAMVVSSSACSKNVPGSGTAQEPMKSATAKTGEAEPVTLKIWAPENQIQTGTLDSMTKSFQALHPEWNITFNVETQGEDTLKDEILKDVSAAGDVFFFASDQLNELINAGAIARLGGSTEEMVKSTMGESVVKTVTKDDAIYGIPFTHNTFIMYYDKSLLNAKDVKSVEGIMAKETGDKVYNFCFDPAGGWKLGAWYYGAGLTIYGESQTDFAAGANWNNSTGVAVTNYLIDLINNPKTAFADDVSLSELTADHRIGAWFDGSWNYNLYKDALGDDLGLAVIPTFNPDGKDYQLKGFYGSKAIGVNSQSQNPAVAVAFAAYLGSEEMQLERFEKNGQVPTNLKAGESEELQEDELAKVIVDEVNTASVMQPTSVEFTSKYWSNAVGIATEIKTGELNKENVQKKLDTFVATLKVE